MSVDWMWCYEKPKEAAAEIERLLLFLGEIAAMGPADKEWDANTLEDAVELAKRALDPKRAEAANQQTAEKKP